MNALEAGHTDGHAYWCHRQSTFKKLGMYWVKGEGQHVPDLITAHTTYKQHSLFYQPAY